MSSACSALLIQTYLCTWLLLICSHRTRSMVFQGVTHLCISGPNPRSHTHVLNMLCGLTGPACQVLLSRILSTSPILSTYCEHALSIFHLARTLACRVALESSLPCSQGWDKPRKPQPPSHPPTPTHWLEAPTMLQAMATPDPSAPQSATSLSSSAHPLQLQRSWRSAAAAPSMRSPALPQSRRWSRMTPRSCPHTQGWAAVAALRTAAVSRIPQQSNRLESPRQH